MSYICQLHFILSLWFFFPVTILRLYSVIHNVSVLVICEFNSHIMKG